MMSRIRMLRRKSPEEPYEYLKTVFLESVEMRKLGPALVAEQDLRVDDLVYADDWYLQVLATEPTVTWRQVPATDPMVTGLYSKIVEAESPTGDPWR